MTKRILLLFASLLLVVGCSGAPLAVEPTGPVAPAATQAVTGANLVEVTEAPPPQTELVSPAEVSSTTEEQQIGPTQSTVTGIAAPVSPPTTEPPYSGPGLEQSNGTLAVKLFSDTDVVVSTPNYMVKGQAPQGTVLSVGDDISVVDGSQAFAVNVPLEEGPNLVEIVASDASGDEVSFELTITYDPSP